jgi:ABC-2 type transport system permease protein
MKIQRIGSLILKEILHGPKQFMFVFAIIAPIILTLLVTLIFGSVLSGKARLGLVDEGNSQMVALAQDIDGVTVNLFSSGSALRAAVELGAIDLGFVIPAAFDAQVRSNQTIHLTIYAWGESHLKDRIMLVTALVHMMRQIAGQDPPVEIAATTLGEASMPWEQRLLPFIVLIAVLIGGIFIPATSLVGEKMKRTLVALGVTPATLGEVYLAKGVLGVFISVVMALVILTMNRAFGSQPLLLVCTLLLGAVMASTLGILLGALVSDLNSLFATIKGLGLLLYAPALVYMFPEIPQWIGRIFPTYYIVQPVIEIVQEGAGWGDVLPEMGVTLGLIALLMVAVALVSKRQAQKIAA